ncbi:leucine-rich repeat flightless-interacting protein 1 isoform 40-T40 [Glossophaga mutica]
MTNPATAQNKEIDCLSPEAQRLAEARLAAKRAARAEAREIRMKELERQQKEIYQVQKKYYGLESKWGDIEQWMEDSERYSRRSRRNTSASDEDERLSVGSRGSLRVSARATESAWPQPAMESGGPCAWTNGYDGDLYGLQSLSRRSGRNSSYSGDGRSSPLPSSREEKAPSCLYSAAGPASGSYRPSEPGGHLSSSSRASSRASSARASPVVEERPEKDFAEKGSRNLPSLSAATLASLGGTSTRRGSGDTSVSVDTEASMREIKELHELKDQIQDVEGKYMLGLKQMKDSLAEVEEKYKKAMVSNAQLDNEKTNYMYQVDTLKDTLLELEEQLAECRRQCEEKDKEFEREKHAHGLLRFQLAEMKAALQQREEMLQKHGIILHSEVTTNGETPDTPTGAGHQGPPRTTKEQPNPALQAPGDGPLGKATEVEVESGMVDTVGKREVLQNTEREQRQEEPVEDGADTQVLPPGDGAEDDSALSLAAVANATNEDEVQSQVLANTSILEHTEQVGSSEVTSTPDAGAGASERWRELDGGDVPGPRVERGGWAALDPLNQSGGSAETQEQEEQDCGTGLAEVSSEPHQEPAPSQISEVDEVSYSQGSAQAGPTRSGEPEGTVASRPPRGSVDTMSQDDRCVANVPSEVDASAGLGSETELTDREAAEPREAPGQSIGLGGRRDEERAEGTGFKGEKPTQNEVQTSPSSAAATHCVQEATGPRTADAKDKPLDSKEPGEDSHDPQGEGLDSPQKKTKNKKKKNKKKKAPVPAEASKDAKKEFPSESPDLSEVKEEEQERCTDENPGAGTPNGAPGGPTPNSVAGSSANPDAPESANAEADGARDPGDGGEAVEEAGRAVAVAGGEPAVPPEGNAVQASGSGVGAGGLEEGAGPDGASPCRPPGDEDVPRGALLGGQRPSEDVDSESQGVREVSESPSPESDGLAPAEERGASRSDSREEAGGQSEKDKSKEDCTLS